MTETLTSKVTYSQVVANHHAGHVPVGRNQPDSERNVDSGLHVNPATLKEFAHMFPFFLSFFLFFW